MIPLAILGGVVAIAFLGGRRKAAASPPPGIRDLPMGNAPALKLPAATCGCSKANSSGAPSLPAQYFAASSTVLGAAVGVAPGQKPAAIVRIA